MNLNCNNADLNTIVIKNLKLFRSLIILLLIIGWQGPLQSQKSVTKNTINKSKKKRSNANTKSIGIFMNISTLSKLNRDSFITFGYTVLTNNFDNIYPSISFEKYKDNQSWQFHLNPGSYKKIENTISVSNFPSGLRSTGKYTTFYSALGIIYKYKPFDQNLFISTDMKFSYSYLSFVPDVYSPTIDPLVGAKLTP